MNKVRQALIYASISKYVTKILALVSIVIVARILTPTELGVYAIAGALVLIASELKSFGAGGYLIKQKQIDKAIVKAALGITMAICWVIGILLIVSASSIESFYGIDDISALIHILSISFFATPFIAISVSLMKRDFQFKELCVIEITAQVIMVICTVVLVYFDFSYFAIAIANAVSSLVQLFLIVVIKHPEMCWFPQFKGMKNIAEFGIFVTSSNLLRRLSFTLPELFIGKLGTTSQVAIFSRANGFMDFLSSTLEHGVRPVIAPYLSEKQKLGEHLEAPFLNSTMLLGAIVWPILAVAGMSSYPLILFFFGEQWIDAAPLAKILCLGFIFKSAIAFTPMLLMISGHERFLLLKEVILFVSTGLTIFFTFSSGLVAIATGISLVGIADFIVTMFILKNTLNFSIQRYMTYAQKNTVLTLSCGLITYWLDSLIDFTHTKLLISIPIIGLSNGLLWLGIAWLQANPIINEINKFVEYHDGRYAA